MPLPLSIGLEGSLKFLMCMEIMLFICYGFRSPLQKGFLKPISLFNATSDKLHNVSLCNTSSDVGQNMVTCNLGLGICNSHVLL